MDLKDDHCEMLHDMVGVRSVADLELLTWDYIFCIFSLKNRSMALHLSVEFGIGGLGRGLM